MADKETSDRILHHLSQVQDVIDDVREHVHKIQRETPDSVPVRFRVYGATAFPIDMLRYDNCVPDEELDAAQIERTFSSSDGTNIFVTLRKLSVSEPSYTRWAAKGWRVE